MSGVSSGIQPIYARHFILRVRYSKIDPEQMKMIEEHRAAGHNVVDDIYSENTAVVEIPSQDPIIDFVAGTKGAGVVEDASEIHPIDMLGVLEKYQTHYADNGVSFTINFPEGEITKKDLRGMFKAYMPRLKGTTFFPDETRALAPYQRITEEEYLRLVQGSEAVSDTAGSGCTSGACPVR
jgi:ribonucleoside-triphosphate reductase